MAVTSKSGKSGSRGEPEKTRAAILRAALEEFMHEGPAGARTEEIARRAGVNKALLYYYFKDKEGLYTAAVEQVLSGLVSRVMTVLDRTDLSPRERMLLYVKTHFDYIAGAPGYTRLVQREFMRSAGRALSPPANRIFERDARPMYMRLLELVEEGTQCGEFRRIEPHQAIASILGIIIFYFISIPALRLMTPGDPLSASGIAERRAAVLDFVSAALFTPVERPKGKRK